MAGGRASWRRLTSTVVAVSVFAAWCVGTPSVAAAGQVPDQVIYSSFVGGNSSDIVADVAIAQDGGIIAVGGTSSPDLGDGLPGVRERGSLPDAFVAKFSPDGSSIEWVAVLGGSSEDSFYAVAVARNGDILAAGQSLSNDFPVTDGAFSTASNDSPNTSWVAEVVVVRLTADGSQVVFSTYLGGEAVDWVRAIGEREDGAIVVAGATTSASFPTTAGAFDGTINPEVPRLGGDMYTPFDAYVAALTANGSGLVYSTLVGGWNNDHINDLVVGPGMNVTVVGFTESDDFPYTPSATALNAPAGQWVGVWAFVARLNETGRALVYSGTIPASGNLWAYALDLDATGGAYVAGQGYSLNTTGGAYNTTEMEYANQTYVAHIDADATSLSEATWLGPEGTVRSLTRTSGGGLAVGLSTYAHDFPVTAAGASATSNHYEGYVGVLSCDLAALVAGTYVSGSGDDLLQGAAAGGNGTLVIGGSTSSADFPITDGAADPSIAPAGGTYQPGNNEGFVSILDVPNATGPFASFTMSSTNVTANTTVSMDASASRVLCAPAADLEFRWDFDGDGDPDTDWSDSPQAEHAFGAPGVYTVTLQVRTPQNATATASTTLHVTTSEEATVPQVTYQAPSTLESDQGMVTVSAVVQDPDGVANVYFVHRAVGSSAFENTSMVRASGDRWTATASIGEGTQAIEYYFLAVDTVGDVARSPEDGLYSSGITVTNGPTGENSPGNPPPGGTPEVIADELGWVLWVAIPAAAVALFVAARWLKRERGPAR